MNTPLVALGLGLAGWLRCGPTGDPSILYFTGSRPEAKLGQRAIYRVSYRLR